MRLHPARRALPALVLAGVAFLTACSGPDGRSVDGREGTLLGEVTLVRIPPGQPCPIGQPCPEPPGEAGAGLTLRLVDGEGAVRTVTTDSAGRFHASLRAGRYGISAGSQAPGMTVTVTPNAAVVEPGRDVSVKFRYRLNCTAC